VLVSVLARWENVKVVAGVRSLAVDAEWQLAMFGFGPMGDCEWTEDG
jgi:hypothetical protein